jgi:hypothetical protein
VTCPLNQNIRLARGGFLTLTNNDLMAQELVQVKGPKVIEKLLAPFGKSMVMADDDMGAMAGKYTLNHTGARVKSRSRRPGCTTSSSSIVATTWRSRRSGPTTSPI